MPQDSEAPAGRHHVGDPGHAGAPSAGAQDVRPTISLRADMARRRRTLWRASLTQGGFVHIIWTILIGFIAGLLARAILPGNNAMGFILTVVLGIAGSLAATYAGQALGLYAVGGGAGFIASVLGAVVLLGVWHLLSK